MQHIRDTHNLQGSDRDSGLAAPFVSVQLWSLFYRGGTGNEVLKTTNAEFREARG